MTTSKFGNKFTCHKCSAKYYDMKKAHPKCPKCGADPKDDPALKAAEKAAKKGQKDEAEGPEFEDDKYEADMDDLVNDEDGDGDDDAEVDEVTGGADDDER